MTIGERARSIVDVMGNYSKITTAVMEIYLNLWTS
jgi:hypothetical protein